jgi:hypothetical protein
MKSFFLFLRRNIVVLTHSVLSPTRFPDVADHLVDWYSMEESRHPDCQRFTAHQGSNLGRRPRRFTLRVA